MTSVARPAAPAEARVILATAYTELTAAAKVAVGDDGGTLLAAAAAVDLAVELLTPPDADVALAANSCLEALHLAGQTRAYAQGGNIANLLEPAKQKVAHALKLLG